MNCKKCGNVLDPNSKFCNVCGEVIEGNNQAVNNGVPPVNNAPVAPVTSAPQAPVTPVNPNPVAPTPTSVAPVPPVAPAPQTAPVPPVNSAPVNNAQVAPNNVNNQIPNNVNPAMNQNVMAQNQVVQPKKNNSLTIIIIVLAVVVVFIAGIVAVTFIFKFAGNESSGSSTQATTSSTTTTTTSKRITTTAEPVSAKVSHYGYNFIIPEGFEVSDKKLAKGMFTLYNRKKNTAFAYNLYSDNFADVGPLVEEAKTQYGSQGATVVVSEDEKNGVKYHLLEISKGNETILMYIIDFKGIGIFMSYAFSINNYGKDNYTDTLIDFVNSAKYETGSFANGGFSNETKPSGEFGVKLPE